MIEIVKEDISEYLMVLDGVSGMFQEIIRGVNDVYIKAYLSHILYMLQKELREWIKTKEHKIRAYKGFSFSVN